MNRRDALRRHRRSVVLIAALLGVILVLLHSVAPRVESAMQDRGLEPNAATAAVLRAGDFVRGHIWPIAGLAAVLVALLWTSYGVFDRPGGRSSGREI